LKGEAVSVVRVDAAQRLAKVLAIEARATFSPEFAVVATLAESCSRAGELPT